MDTPGSAAAIPDDDPKRDLTVGDSENSRYGHICVVGDTYTVLLAGADTAGRYCLIDMHVPKGGGPPLHRHDFEEMFTVLEGEIVVTFRDREEVVRAGQTCNVPANAPHHFTNAADAPARLHCMCTPAGQEQFFLEIGVPVATRTSPPPPMTDDQKRDLLAKTKALAPRYNTVLLVE